VNRLRTLAYLTKFFTECMPIYPVYAIMFAERSDLSTGQISQLFFIWLGVAWLSEIPTGVLADRLSRRWLITGGAALQGVAFVVWLWSPTYWGYAAGFVLWGICWAMYSGAFQAYLFDELETLGKGDHFNRIYTRCEAMSFAGKVLAYLATTIIGAERYSLLLVISIAIAGLSVFLSASLPRERRRPHAELTSGVHTLRLAFDEVRRSPLLVRLVLTVTISTSVVIVVPEYVPLFFKPVGVDLDWIPVLLVVGLGISTALAWTAHRWMRYPIWVRLAFNSVFALIFVLLTLSSSTLWAAVGMISMMRVLFLTSALQQASLQHAVDQRTRATVGSFPMFAAEGLAAFSFAVFGMVSYLLDDQGAYLVMGSTIVMASLGLTMMWRRFRPVDDTVMEPVVTDAL
jgi:MFS family permease